ncbi:MAG TPA: NAD(P)-binding domain-containing protein [Solirubrobacteraceae bacterium]|nr:NAD(P)-binding domain-containing protein [Solirubrobacteraceae bacterium]
MTGVERIETVVVGAGQAGLSVGHHLAKRGRPFVILHANERVGDNWRRQWDSLRLFSPARLDGLPGMPFPAPGWSFPTKDETADYLERYAERFELPVRGGTRVARITRGGDGGYVVDCDDGPIAADNVVVATGTFGRPSTPPFAGELDPRIVQLHSSEYRRPSLLQDGPVLVVGASHSGADVAMDVAPTHRTILAGRDTGQAPVDIESRRGRAVWLLLAFMARRVLTLKTPMGRKMRSEIRSHGGPLLRHRRADLEAAGVERTTARVAGVRDGRPLLDDGTVLDVANVVWCTGFKQDFGWIEPPVCGEDGWPLEERGVVASAPGLYFAGLAFQYAFSSMLLLGAGRDAEHVAGHIATRMAERQVAVAA